MGCFQKCLKTEGNHYYFFQWASSDLLVIWRGVVENSRHPNTLARVLGRVWTAAPDTVSAWSGDGSQSWYLLYKNFYLVTPTSRTPRTKCMTDSILQTAAERYRLFASLATLATLPSHEDWSSLGRWGWGGTKSNKHEINIFKTWGAGAQAQGPRAAPRYTPKVRRIIGFLL